MNLVYSLLSLLTDTSVIFGVIILTLYVVLRHMFIDRSNGLPPGPRFRLPLIGNLYDVDTDIRKFLRRYRKRYGDIYSLYFGTKQVIVISGYNYLKEAFVKNGEIFSDRPKGHNIFTEITKGKGVANVDGELWREHRKFSLLTLRSFGMGRSVLEQTIHSEVLILLKLFRARSQAFDPGDLIYVSVSNVINALSFGGHFKHDDSRYKEMIKKVSENFANVGLSGIGFFIPGLVHLPGDMLKIKQTLKNAEDVYSFLREFSIEHLQNYDENNIDNFTSAFIKEMKKQERLQETSTYTMDQLVGVLGDFFVAGTETTSSILRWALVYLVNFQELQEQMYNSIKDEIGVERLPSLQDRSRVPMIDAFMQECLRSKDEDSTETLCCMTDGDPWSVTQHNWNLEQEDHQLSLVDQATDEDLTFVRHADLFPTTLARAVSRDTIFNGYLIPTDATILGNVDSVNQNIDLWKDPEVFRPQRFIDESGCLTTPDYFVPFFIGRRSCLGEALAKMEMFLFLSAIVQNFQISAPPGEDLSLGTLDTFGLVHVPKRYNIIATPRRQSSFDQ